MSSQSHHSSASRKKSFFEKPMHTNQYYSNHTYFRNSRAKTEESLADSGLNPRLKQFVEMPKPFGIDNTYAYLRKVHVSRLPCLPPPTNKFSSVSKSQLQQTFIRLTQSSQSPEIVHTQQKTPPKPIEHRQHSSSLAPPQQKIFPMKIVLYEKSNLFAQTSVPHRQSLNRSIRNHSSVDVSNSSPFRYKSIQLNIFKFITNCFLKCPLKLENMTLDQYKRFQKYLGPAIQQRRKQKSVTASLTTSSLGKVQEPLTSPSASFVPKAALGINKILSLEMFLNKIAQFQKDNRLSQIYHLLYHFIIPSQDVLTYNRQAFLSEINSLNQISFGVEYSIYDALYTLEGVRIDSMLTIDPAESLLIACSDVEVDAEQLSSFKLRIVLEMKEKERLRKQRELRSKFHLDESKQSTQVSKSLKPEQYKRLETLFEMKHKRYRNSKDRIKYKNPLLEVRIPFIDKTKLVKENELFS